ncbi:hypothetical protein XENTR_v10002836 [Xenopus tropicalis]|nr:hypothetical protein XENTR_v10002836 [Xenopus tropicalis]
MWSISSFGSVREEQNSRPPLTPWKLAGLGAYNNNNKILLVPCRFVSLGLEVWDRAQNCTGIQNMPWHSK